MVDRGVKERIQVDIPTLDIALGSLFSFQRERERESEVK
jgi:hypothetical protein